MAHTSATVGIDIRLIAAQRTGDAAVFLNLTRSLLKRRDGLVYRLYTYETDQATQDELRALLGCMGRSDVEIVGLPWATNRFLWNALVLPWALWRRPVDIFHTQYIAPLSLPHSIKLVTHIHDVSFAAHPEWIRWTDRIFLRWLIPRSLRRSALILVPSRFTQTEIARYYPWASERVRVVPNAVSDEWERPLTGEFLLEVRTRLKLPERYIVASGTMQPRKNIPLLIRAWRERDASLASVGLVLTGDPLGHNVDPVIQSLLTPEIIFTGYLSQTELRAVIAQADILAFPSLYEGFGIPLLEAFATGVPVWASAIPPFIEVGGSAFVAFDPQNLAEAKESLYNLLVDQKNRQRLVQAGHERLTLFRWSESAEKLASLYQALLRPPLI